jgi:hypothetical protein
MVVLDKTDVQTGQVLPGTLVETLEKKATFIAEYPRLKDQDVGDGGCDDIHSILLHGIYLRLCSSKKGMAPQQILS